VPGQTVSCGQVKNPRVFGDNKYHSIKHEGLMELPDGTYVRPDSEEYRA